MAYEARTFQSSTAYTAPSGTDPLVDNTTSGDVQAVKLLDGTAGSTTDVRAGGGVEANALRVTIANDSTGVVSVDDNGATLSVDDGGGTLTVDGTVAATQSGTWTVQPGNTANTTAWLVTGTGGTFPVTDSGGSLTVDGTVTANLAAGTNNIGDVDIVSGPTGASALQVQGAAAHDAAAAGNPIQIGSVAETTRPAAVADGDAVRPWLDEIGRQVVLIGSGEENFVAAEYTSSQTDTSLIAAPGAGLYIRIFDVVISTGTAGTVLLEEGTATRLFGRISLAANGGWSFNSAKGVRLGTANTALTITTTTGAGPLAVTVNYSIEP